MMNNQSIDNLFTKIHKKKLFVNFEFFFYGTKIDFRKK